MVTHYVCRKQGCTAYGVLVLYSTVYLRRSRDCVMCGTEMRARPGPASGKGPDAKREHLKAVAGSPTVYRKSESKPVKKKSHKKSYKR